MTRTRRWTIWAALVVFVAALGAAAAPARAADLLDEIKKRGYMRVGTFSIPPEAWIEVSSGEWQGIDADFTKAIAKKLGVEVDPIVLVHTEMVPALNSGRLDAIAGLYHTAERAKVVDYNTIPFWYGIDVLIARKDDASIKGFADLKGKTLGTVRGSAQEKEANQLKEKFAVADIKKYESADPMLMDLRARRLDAAIWWGFTFDYAVKKNPGYDLRVVQYMPPEYLGESTLPGTYFIFKKGPESAGLIKAFDATLREMLAAGESRKVLEKYGLDNPAYWTGKLTPR
jgi:ABC-type amino acid transport substrate-binding protein